MKDWQKGYDLEYLKLLEEEYTSFNARIRSPFMQFKKHNIADALSKKELVITRHQQFYNVLTMYTVKTVKAASNIVMHGDTIIGRKETGDFVIDHIVGDWQLFLKDLEKYAHQNTWLVVNAGSYRNREIVQSAGFKFVGVKINTFSDIFAYYYRDSLTAFAPRIHPIVPNSEKVGMKKLFTWDDALATKTLHQLNQLNPTFMNHYSNYNKNNAWSALSLRGYTDDPLFIEKPEEMNDAWKLEHTGETFRMQWTPLAFEFKPILTFLESLWKIEQLHRIRFMKLTPGGGELQRHTDQVDPDAGSVVGKLARLHFPIKTNPDVIFTTWNEYDQPIEYHFAVGECWYLDTRKPHMAVNNGTEERIHLVVDVEVTPALETVIGAT